MRAKSQRVRTLLAALLAAVLANSSALASGWFSPDGTSAPGGQWANGNRAIDGSTTNYASHTSPGAGLWGAPLWLTNATTFKCGRVKVYSDWDTYYVDRIRLEIRIQPAGAWSNVYEGSVLNCSWTEITFASTNIDAARYSYHYVRSGVTFWLYEFMFYEDPPQVNLPSCETDDATSVEETSGILHGTVISDGGEPCQYRFQYGLTVDYSTNTDWGGSLSTDSAFSTLITGLASNSTYHFRAQIRNSAGVASGSDKTLETGIPPTGWVSPLGYGSSGTWTNIPYAFDDDLNSFATCYHNIGAPIWSSDLYLTHPSMVCEKIRFNARNTAEIDACVVDLDLNGTWTNVYNSSAFGDKQWVEAVFPQGTVTQARVRFSVTSTSYGMDWQLYEFDFYRVVGVTLSGAYDGLRTVSLAVDGQFRASFTNFSTNVFTFAVSLGAGSKILLFYDDDGIATNGAALVTKATGADMLDLHLVGGALTVRNDYGAALSAADLVAARYSDADVPYDVSGNGILVTNAIALRIPAGHTLAMETNTLTLRGGLIHDGALDHAGGTAVFAGQTTVSGLSTAALNHVTVTGALTAHTNVLRVSGNWDNNGTFNHNSGTVVFDGNTAVGGASLTAFSNVTIAAGRSLTAPAALLNVSGAFVNNGTFNHNNGTVVFNGPATVGGASLTAFSNVMIAAGSSLTGPSGSIQIQGNWSNSGAFNHNNGAVAFAGSSTGSVLGANTFWDLTCATPGKQINFAANTNQTVLGTLTVAGSAGAGNLIRLHSVSSPAKWFITFPNGPQSVSYADVKDSDALSNTVTVVGGADQGNNNTNWIFAQNRFWVGGSGNWSDTNHWALVSGGAGGASVPDAGHLVVFDTNSGASALCTVDTAVNVKGMVLDTAGTVSLSQGANAIALQSAGLQQKAGSFSGGSGPLDIAGVFDLSGGVFTAPSNNLCLRSDFTHTGGVFSNNAGTVVFAGNTVVTDSIMNPFAHVVISNSLTAPAGPLYVTGNWTNIGAFAHNNGTVVFSGNTVMGGTHASTFNDVTISGALTAGTNALHVVGAWANNGTFNPGNGAVVFDGSTEITGSSTSAFHDVAVTGSLLGHASKPVKVAGDWINDGVFIHNGGAVVFDGNTTAGGGSVSAFNHVTIQGTLIAPTGAVKVAGAFVNNGSFDHKGGTVIFNGSSAIQGANATLLRHVEIWGAMTAPATNLYVSGNWVNHGTFNHNTGTVVFDGTTLLSGANASDFNTMTVTGSATLVLADRIGDGSAVNVLGTLDLAGKNDTIGSLSGTGQVLLGNAFLTVAGSASTVFSGVIVQSGSLVRQGSGSLTLSGANTYGGDTRVETGTLKIGISNALPVSCVLRMGNAGNTGTSRFDVAGCNQKVAGLTSAGTTMRMTVTNSAAAPSVFTVSNSASCSYAGLIGGNITLVKDGPGTLALEGGSPVTHTYTGPTLVGNGALQIGANCLVGSSTDITVATNAQLTVVNTGDAINDNADIHLESGAKFYLTNGVSETVASLSLNGQLSATGSWGTVNCQWTNTDFFAGSGILIVTSGVTCCAITAFAGPHGTIAPSGFVSVAFGGGTNFVMTPDADYHVADVLVDGFSVGATNAYAFVNVTSNHTISASFAIDTVVQITNTLDGVLLPFRATFHTLGGRAVNLVGDMGYTNRWNGGTNWGTFAADSNWNVSVHLPQRGTHSVVVYGTNAAGERAQDNVTLVRGRNQIFWFTGGN